MSRKSNHHIHFLGAVIVKRGRIVGMGYNQLKTHTRANTKYSTIHAEFDAMRGVDPIDLQGADCYVFRQTRQGNLARSKPCPCCQSLLSQAGIRNVYYTSPEGYHHMRIN